MRVGLICISVLAALPLLAQNHATAEEGINSYSLEKEAALGKRLAAELRKRSTLIDNPTVRDYVDRLGKNLAAHMPEAKVHFTFSVTAEDPCSTVHEPAALRANSILMPSSRSTFSSHAFDSISNNHLPFFGERITFSGLRRWRTAEQN
jgi:hypothetical protein